jgi:hypothetical protein
MAIFLCQPIMDGPTATRAIRALGYTGRIFGVTGAGMASDLRTFTESGVDRVILKPFSLPDFHSALVGRAVFGESTPRDWSRPGSMHNSSMRNSMHNSNHNSNHNNSNHNTSMHRASHPNSHQNSYPNSAHGRLMAGK